LRIFRFLYNVKFHFDIFDSQFSWIFGKFPLAMSMLYLLEKLGIIVVGMRIIIYASIGFIIFVIGGFILKKIGIYEIEQKVNANNNPVQKEIYEAACVINRRNKDWEEHGDLKNE
jgi:hypothetical protein